MMVYNGNFYNERELFDPVKLCDPHGCLNADSIGWSKNAIFKCNLSGRWMRKKKWNYWSIASSDCVFSVTISNFDYAGMVSAYFYDFQSHAFIEKTIIIPLGIHCMLPETVQDDVFFSSSKIQASMVNECGNIHICVKCMDFEGVPLYANITVLYQKGYDTLNVVIPWNKRTFQFTSKHEGMSVKGSLLIGTKKYELNPDDAFACLDYGRGIWPRKISWNWANISGIADGKRVGVNLGAKWTDKTGMTENAVILDGKLEKISEDVVFEYDCSNYLNEWHIQTKQSDAVDLVFHPEYERVSRSNFFLVKSELHQIIGRATGTIRSSSADGQIVQIKNLIGSAEYHDTIW